MGEKKKIVIAEDQTLVRKGLRYLLTTAADDWEVVGEAEDGIAAIRSAQQYEPDLILLDLSMPRMNGIAAIKDIKAQDPQVKILALTVHKGEEHILAAFEAGVDGYCLKDAREDELVAAIRTVLSGRRFISPDIADQVLVGYVEGKKTLRSTSSWDSLTQREKEILKLVGEGYQSKEIADCLCISWKTVEKHRANIMEKLNLHSAPALTAYAIEKGLVTK
jgi:DNA-binding NarL/FixJ family response regulator